VTYFLKYENKFGDVRLQRVAQPGTAGKKNTAWGKILEGGWCWC
jgi:hypothetical protein